MKIFFVKNHLHPPFIILRSSTWCSWNCWPCFRSIKNYKEVDIFYWYNTFLNIFNFIEKNFVKEFWILFLWKNLFSNNNRKNLEKILNFHEKSNRRIFIQSSFLNIKQNIEYIKDISLKYNFTLLYDLNIYSNIELKELLGYITLKELKINIYISLEFSKKYHIFLEKLFSKWKKERDYYIYNSNKVYFINRKEILEKEWYLDNLYYDKCLVVDNTEIIDNKIYLWEWIEIVHNWDITYHMNPYCSVGINKITNIIKGYDEIIKDFLTFKDKIILRNSKQNIWKSCFNCINNPFNNE